MKNNYFYAMLSRMKYINRWGLMRNTRNENLSEHSLEVAFIAHALGVINNEVFGGDINAERLAVLGMYHDVTEIITGDMPTPVKYYSQYIRNAYKEVEQVANEQMLSGLPENRVIGSGTVLDSARLRYKLGEHLSVDSRSVHAFIVGEHGDSEVVAWSSANVSGVPLSEMCEMRGHYKHKENTAEIATAVKNSAYEIINKKHATYYGIAMSVKRICEVIMRDEKSILPVSHMIHGVYDIDGVSLSMPAIVGADGIESDIPINLSGEEALKLKESADSLKKIMETIEL